MFEHRYNRAMRCAGLSTHQRTKEAKTRAQMLYEAGGLSDAATDEYKHMDNALRKGYSMVGPAAQLPG